MQNDLPSNPIIDRLPKHLRSYIHPQHYAHYSAVDQAVWRYVMRLNRHLLPQIAHSSYLEGLEKTGIETGQIPNMYGMNRILKDIGWAAVAVRGFIPPQAFMAFQAYQVLVIASDIRTLEHIGYTPAPDILHEGAGHAPIIANPEYAEYLRRFGEIGSKAISNTYDKALYTAVRTLSDIKENPATPPAQIKEAEEAVIALQQKETAPSELAQIRNLHWWTVEYGLIGSMENPKIYGAGLLSSISESQSCLSDEVKKIPYTLAAAQQGFDITKPQPQLFVTPDFAHLSMVLEEFAQTMALRNGGLEGLHQLIASEENGTIELSTGLQVSGLFTQCIEDKGKPIYLQTQGPTALAYQNSELIGQGVAQHPDGFGSPIGKLKHSNLAIEDMTPHDLRTHGIYEGKRAALQFEGDICVEGEVVTGTRNIQGKIMVVKFKNCRVTHGDKVLFHPDWGVYDMAVGKEVVAAYSGVADPDRFPLDAPTKETQPEKLLPPLNEVYAAVRQLRNQNQAKEEQQASFLELLQTDGKADGWLAVLEICEWAQHSGYVQLAKDSRKYLKKLQRQYPELQVPIDDGLLLLEV
ncbi:MAG: aromatic amino acid hydroxylase [Flavobacteriaceae bacterium]